jgi:hypothetical protein
VSDLPPLPRADDAERYCIGCLIAFPESADEVFTRLKATDFFDQGHQRIFDIAARQHAAGGIDRVLLGKEAGAVEILIDLGINPHNAPATAVHIPTEAAKIIEARRKRQLFQISDDARHAALNGKCFDTAFRSLTADLDDLHRDSRTAIELPTLASVESRAVDWAWPGYLPKGMLTLCDGDPERGKSQITCDVAARWTYPRPFPFARDEQPRGAGNVLMVAAEDNADTTIKPRCEAAAANVERIHLWPEDIEPIKFPSGIEALAAVVKRYDIGLAIFDPIGAYFDENINTNRDADVRRALRPLVALAQETNMAVLAVRHLNKDESKSALYRGGGSIAFTAAARVVWAVGSDPNDPSRLVLAVLKSNIGPKPPALSYSIEGVDGTSRIRWEGESSCTASELFSRKPQRGGKTSDAKALLREMLSDGPKPETEVWEACEAAHIGEWAYKQARKQLEVKSSKGSMREGWLLALPKGGGFDQEEGQHADTK